MVTTFSYVTIATTVVTWQDVDKVFHSLVQGRTDETPSGCRKKDIHTQIIPDQCEAKVCKNLRGGN